MPPPPHRNYNLAQVKGRNVPFSYWPVRKMSRRMAVQSVLFSADPWAIMRQCIRTTAPVVAKPEALALLEQAQDYYRAATSADTFAAKPVLLYYCYLYAARGRGDDFCTPVSLGHAMREALTRFVLRTRLHKTAAWPHGRISIPNPFLMSSALTSDPHEEGAPEATPPSARALARRPG